MKFSPRPVALAVLVATTQFTGLAYGQAPKAPAAPAIRTALAATRAPIAERAPDRWIVYDDATYTPVVDDVSRHLDAARTAFDAKDSKKAAMEMRAVADELKRQAARAGKDDRSLVKADKELLAADTKLARVDIERLNASALKVGSAASAIESGKIRTHADLDKAIDKAARGDMERRWLVSDVTTWYPVSEEPQRHFTDALAAFVRKDYESAATDIRKASGYLRLEVGRATGDAKRELEGSVAQLDALAVSVGKGAVKDEQRLTGAFAKAGHALAFGHRAKAAESLARREYDKVGYELKASASGLASAAGWAGGEAKAGALATVAGTRALGDKLASGATWTQDEVAKGLESLGNGINALGRDIAGTRKTT